MESRPFVLSGGGARAFAHLGVVKALQEHGISPSAFSGTSAGAIAGAFLACGFTPDEVREIFVGKFTLSLLSYYPGHMGLASMHKVKEFLRKNLRCQHFEGLQVPLHVAATNFMTGRQHIFRSGDLVAALEAACSVPALFPPVYIDNIPYVDGGLSSNLPVEPFCGQQGETVCIYVNPTNEYRPNAHVWEVLDRAWHLSFREMVDRSAEGCHLYIEPKTLHGYGMFDTGKLGEIFDVGYTFASEMLQ